MLNRVALGVSSLALLLVVIGLALPLYTMDFMGQDIKFGVKETDANGKKTDMWASDACDKAGDKDDCKAAQSMLKGCFAFCFMGMLVNIALIVSLVAANGFDQGKLPAPLGQKLPTVGIAAVLSVFYLIGMALALASMPTAYDNNSTLKDELKVGVGSVFLIIAFIAAIAATILSFVGISSEAASGEGDSVTQPPDAENPPVVAPTVTAEQTQPPGAVYQKNGQWIDKDGKVVAPAGNPNAAAAAPAASDAPAASNDAPAEEGAKT